MEMEVGNDVLGDVLLSRLEPKVAHLGLHDEFLIHLAIDEFWVNLLQHLNGTLDAGLEFLECLFIVLKDGHIGCTEAMHRELGRV